MTMRAAAASIIAGRRLSPLALRSPAARETKTGLRVSIDPGEFGDAASLQVAVSALTDGFKPQHATQNMGGALVTTEDFDGDGALDLVARFNGPFRDTLSFRVDTDNQTTLAVRVTALAFNDHEPDRGRRGRRLAAGRQRRRRRR